jgi:hypothetical protein
MCQDSLAPLPATQRSRSRGVAPLAVVAFLAASAIVRPAYAALGDGIEFGPGRLKLGIDVTERYDDAAGAGVVTGNPSDFITLILGKFLVGVKTDSVYVDFGGGVGWNQYSGAFNHATQSLSFVSANAKGEIDINRDRPVGFEISEFLNRSDQTTNPVFGLGVLALADVTRARLHFRPGGGAIEIGVSGEVNAGVYDSLIQAASGTTICSTDPRCNPSDIHLFNSTAYKAQIDGTWRFLPKTGLMFEVSYQDWTYAASSVGDGQANVPAQPVVANIGFGTLLTTRLSFTIKVGYEGIFFTNTKLASNVQTFDGQVEISYHFTDNAFARIGAARSYTPVAGDSHDFGDNRIYLDGSVKATQALTFNLTGTVDFIDFATSPVRNDQAYGVNLNAAYAATNWLNVVAGFVFAARNSTIEGSGNSTYSYNRIIANLGLQTFF